MTMIPPWHPISTTSSPVKLCGAGNQVRRTSSIASSFSGVTIFPKCWYRGFHGVFLFFRKIFCEISTAFSPLMRMSAIAPCPGGVAMAAIVPVFMV